MKRRLKFLPYRRKLEGRTNYKKRLMLLVSGTTRLVIRKSNKNIIVQLVDYSDKGDTVLATVKSTQLKKYGWNHASGNIPAAYLTGLLAGKLAKEKKVTKAIVDLGLQTPSKGSRLYAAVKGVIDSGLSVSASEEIFPSEERISGKHLEDYSKKPITKDFDDVKKKLL